MMDTPQLVHMCVTTITSLATIVLGYLNIKNSKDKLRQSDYEYIEDKVNKLELNVAVLAERIANQHDMLIKIDNKLEDIKDNL